MRLFVVGPPSHLFDRFEGALERAGSFSVSRGAWYVAAAPRTSRSPENPDQSLPEARISVIAGRHSPGPGSIPVGGAQLAVVPVQADPDTLRAWISWVPSEIARDPVQAAVDAFIAGEREASRALQADVEAHERARDSNEAWTAQSANLRRALLSSGVTADAVDRRLEALRVRWAAVQRGAGAQREDEPPSA